MRLPPQCKTESDTLDYDIDFTDWLNEPDAIASASVVADDGVDVAGSQVFGPIVKLWLAGGETGHSYNVSVTTTTNEGRVVKVCFNLRVTGC